jgi:hypothetical protein
MFSGALRSSNMSDREYAKAQAQQKTLTGSSPSSRLLQRTCVCGGSHGIDGLCTECRDKRLTLPRFQRAVEPPSAPGAVPGSAPAQEHGPSFNSAFDRASRFEYDFSRIPIHPPAAGAIQTKLAINQPGDEYEQEADHIADQVMRMAEPMPIASAPAAIQRNCAGYEDEKEKAVPTQLAPSMVVQPPLKGATTCPVALQSVEGQEEEYPPVSQAIIFRKAEFAAPRTIAQWAPSITDRLVECQAEGEPLPAMTRQRMENAFGHNFSRVRIHRDAEAGEISRQLSALAFTHGSHIYFGNGRYDPDRSSGKRLLAHELTHVVQQGQAAPQQSSEAATSVVVQAHSPAIQRVATWAAGAVHETNNLANSDVNGPPVGVTWPTLNGATFWGTAAARAALMKPTLAFSSAAGGGVNANVATVPTNTGSFDETVLAPGPWTVDAPKTTIGAMFPALTMCTGAGNSTFQAIGDPSDVAMFAANRRHEDHHAADHRAAFNGSIVPWDTGLTAAQAAGTEFNGPTEAAAEAALYAAIGGTPDQVADAFMNACAAAVVAFHSTAAGGPVGAPTNPTANADCSTSSAKYTNPS